MKLHLRKGATILNYGCRHTVQHEYWTTASGIASGILNLRKQIAKKEMYDIKYYRFLEIYVDTLEVVW